MKTIALRLKSILFLLFIFITATSFGSSESNFQPAWYKVVGDGVIYLRAKDFGGQTLKAISSGSYYYVVAPKNSHGFMKIQDRGRTYFLESKYLKYYGATPPEESNRLGTETSYNYNNPKSYLMYVIIALALALIFINFGYLGNILVATALPIIIHIYLNGTYSPLWMCSPSKVGWGVTLLSFCGVLLICVELYGIIIKSINGVMQIFKGYIISGLLSLALIPVCGFVILEVFVEFIDDGLWLIIPFLMIFVPVSREFIGTYTDKDGTVWDVYIE